MNKYEKNMYIYIIILCTCIFYCMQTRHANILYIYILYNYFIVYNIKKL